MFFYYLFISLLLKNSIIIRKLKIITKNLFIFQFLNCSFLDFFQKITKIIIQLCNITHYTCNIIITIVLDINFS